MGQHLDSSASPGIRRSGGERHRPPQTRPSCRHLRAQAQRSVSTVFVDTSGFFALYARNDADHPSAV